MANIQKFSTERLRVEEDFGFLKRIEAETEHLTNSGDKRMVDGFKYVIGEFDKALKTSAANPYAEAVTTADERADAAWRGLKSQAKLNTGHPVEANRTAATTAYKLILKYGEVASLPFNEEYGALLNLLQDMTTLGVENQQLAGIDAWVVELQTRYDEFMTAIRARDAEEGKRVTGIVKQCRIDADQAYQGFIEWINAITLVNGTNGYSTFITNVNVIIDHTKAQLSARSTRAKTKSKAATGGE